MKSFFITVFMSLLSFTSFAEDTCPRLAGEYISHSCPKANTSYTTIKIHQSDCKVIGFQRTSYKSDGSTSTVSAINWEPVGAGKLLTTQNATGAQYVDRFYDKNALFAFHYVFKKGVAGLKFQSAESIQPLYNGNLLVNYFSSGLNQTSFNMNNCN